MERTREIPGQPEPAPTVEPAPRRPYTPPTVTCYGDIEDLTQGGGMGGQSDGMGFETPTV